MSSYKLKHYTKKKISEGKFYPLGATIVGDGVNFAIYSENATEVYLLLFDAPDADPTDIIQVENRDRNVWHVFVHNVKAGQLYGYKIAGPYMPQYGLRFNENKLLTDPYSKAFSGKYYNKHNLLLPYNPFAQGKDLVMDKTDNTKIVPKSIVIDDSFNWEDDKSPDVKFEDLIIYEAHVKGLTAHKSSKSKASGTYLGVIDKIPYLKELGINAIEFLPVHEYYNEDFLVDKKMTNYWGYNTVGFFAPEISYSTQKRPGCQVEEFKTMVKELHKAGIEVILDVVYNHTAEGNELGATISFKGIDNPTYYVLTGDASEPKRYYMNHTGCGNSLNLANPAVIRLVMDSLRYWVKEMRVDGFRFDLASVLGRETNGFYKGSSFFDAISQDPDLCKVKLIAEPWDLGTYEVGNFPIDWAEWNGKFRDNIRKFVKGEAGQLKELGSRLTGSADLYQDDGRSAYNSINFITCHDGFCLKDLVSYNYKHNEANLENNNDGSNDNHSWNCGFEGETDDLNVNALRIRQMKNFISYLMFSFGTPMLLGGDEFGRTQNGNNNSYCQDNEINWLDWALVEKNKDVFNFAKKAIRFRKDYAVYKRRKFFTGRDQNDNLVADIQWYGENLNSPDWNNPNAKLICCLIDGSEAPTKEKSEYFLFYIFNADHNEHSILLPEVNKNMTWSRVVDTSADGGKDFFEKGSEIKLNNQSKYLVNPRSVAVLILK